MTLKTFSYIANDYYSAHPVSQPGPFKQQERDNSCSPCVKRTQEDQTWGRTGKGFLLTQNMYCRSLHKRALGLEQLTYSCRGRCTALSYCVCIYVAGQYLCRRTLLLDFFRLGSKSFERHLQGNQGQIILLKHFTVQMHDQKNKWECKEALIQQNNFLLVKARFYLWTSLNEDLHISACKDTVEPRPEEDMKGLVFLKNCYKWHLLLYNNLWFLREIIQKKDPFPCNFQTKECRAYSPQIFLTGV